MNAIEFINFINKQIKTIDFANHNTESQKIFEYIAGFSINKAFLYTKKFDTKEAELIIEKRKTGMPLAYILGYEYFFGYKFIVKTGVLIPRPDSEILVQIAIENCIGGEKLVDLCSGSGCLGIAIAKNIILSELTLVDISLQAIDISKQNADYLNIKANFLCQDVLDIEETAKLIEDSDILISNPPYIEQETFDTLESQVKDFEPKIALTDCKNGLTFYESLVRSIYLANRKPKLILFEIGFNQAENVIEIAKNLNDSFTLSVINDLSNRNRVIMLKKLST